MEKFVTKILTGSDIKRELLCIGFDSSYAEQASEKFLYKNIKIYDLTPAQANIIKQTALTVGADCATHREVITGNIEKSDVILTGSVSQIKKIADKLSCQPFSLKNLGQELINQLNNDVRKTQLVGIVNVTPDSFSDGGLYLKSSDAIEHIQSLINDGADIIELGAESTRPFSEPVDSEEQIRRIEPVLKELTSIKVPVSIDTRSSEVAEFVLDNGASIINDVSGFDFDSKISDIIAKYGATAVIQHSNGTPENMQNSPYYDDVVEEVYKVLMNKIEKARGDGIKDIIIDPGIGFGKNKEHNFEILNRIEEFYSLKCPLMVGISRKAFLGKYENNNDLRDAITLAVSYPLIQKGVDYLRVHNVKLHRQLLNLTI